MAITLNATPGDPNANSFETVAGAADYILTRNAGVAWTLGAEAQKAVLIQATRVLSALAVPHVRMVRPGNGDPYNITSRTWTGSIATDTQALAWPRIGMRDRLGRAIPHDVIPIELKEATSELAWQLGNGDRTLDNDAVVQGLRSVSAGSVSVSFKDNIEAKVLPDLVLSLMPPSWFTDEIYSSVRESIFEVL